MLIYESVPFAAAAPSPGEAFSIGSIIVYWQGILLAAAILLAILLTSLEAGRKRLPRDTTADLCLVLIPCGILGARLWHVLVNYAYYAGDFVGILRFWDGGLAIYGAVVFAALGVFVYALKMKINLFRLLDALTPGLIAALAIILWGDFFSQSGYGAEVVDAAQMWFPLAVLIAQTDTIHYAVFFYEFLWCALTFGFIWFFVRKRERRDGSVFLWATLLYCAGHGVFNALRAEHAALAGPFSLTQAACAAAALAAALLLIWQSGKPLPFMKASIEAERQDVPPDTACAAAESSVPGDADAPAFESDGRDARPGAQGITENGFANEAYGAAPHAAETDRHD